MAINVTLPVAFISTALEPVTLCKRGKWYLSSNGASNWNPPTITSRDSVSGYLATRFAYFRRTIFFVNVFLPAFNR
jgi:hypothetical protein